MATDALRRAAEQFTPEAFERLPAAERAALGARHVHGDDQVRGLYAMTRAFAGSVGDMAFTAGELAAITARTLIVHGDRDPFYPVELAVELYRGIRQSALWVVPDGGHGPIFGPLAEAFRATALAHLALSA